MKVNQGVEWSAHALVLLSSLPEGRALSRERLAEFHGVPPAYMGKQLQALSRAGLIRSTRGRGGGYRLAKPATEITLRDVFEAVEGAAPAFVCRNIRRNGPHPTPPELCKTPCPIAAAMLDAEAAYREALASITIADLAVRTATTMTPDRFAGIFQWMNAD